MVTKTEVKYRWPAHYDEVLTLRTTVTRITSVRIDHRHELYFEGRLLAEGATTLACVDRQGRPQALPEYLRDGKERL